LSRSESITKLNRKRKYLQEKRREWLRENPNIGAIEAAAMFDVHPDVIRHDRITIGKSDGESNRLMNQYLRISWIANA